jgi:hypothetical protein
LDPLHLSPPAASLRPFRAGYFFGGFNGLTWMMSLGTPMVLLIEHLGGSTIAVGMASSFVFLLLPIQMLATSTLERLGFQRQMVLGWSLRAVFLLIPLAIVLTAPAQPAAWMPNAIVISVFGFCFFRAFGMAAHIAWFAAILPDSLRGRFFATDTAITSGVGVVTLLGCAALFARLPPYDAFTIAYAIALFGSVLAVVSLLRLPSGPSPPPSPVGQLAGAARSLCFGPGLFRQFLVLTVVGAVVGSSFSAFTTYYLKSEAAISSSRILGFTAAQFGGQIVGTFALRPFIDRMPIRRLFQLAQAIVACVFAYWLGIVVGETGWLGAIAVSYFVFGLAVGIGNAAHATFLPELSPAAMRPVSVAVFGAVAGLLQGLGPMLWGLVLRIGGGAPGVDLESFRLFFGLGIALCALSLYLLVSLPDVRAGMRALESS